MVPPGGIQRMHLLCLYKRQPSVSPKPKYAFLNAPSKSMLASTQMNYRSVFLNLILFRYIIVLLLTVAIKMKFNLCSISIAFPLKSGVYCNRNSDFSTWESERQANTGSFLETRDLVLPTAKKLAKHQEEGKDISGRLYWFCKPLLIFC